MPQANWTDRKITKKIGKMSSPACNFYIIFASKRVKLTANHQMDRDTKRQELFDDIVGRYHGVISKVCLMYARDNDHFKDLYQEVTVNLWQGLESFEGRSAMSTWIYRTAINTCISYFRRYHRHDNEMSPLDSVADIPVYDSDRVGQLREMYRLIAGLRPLDKAIIMMWLDELSYEEIGAVTGLSRNNVASRLRRIKISLSKQAQS